MDARFIGATPIKQNLLQKIVTISPKSDIALWKMSQIAFFAQKFDFRAQKISLFFAKFPSFARRRST
jgi:hypothetical protein